MRPYAEQHVSAMGTKAHIVIVGREADRRLGSAIERVFDLEQRWSRFSPTSEVSRFNAACGEPVAVSADTITLVEHGVAGWRLTDGSFDPTMALQIAEAGYDRDFGELATKVASSPPRPAAGCEGLTIDRAASEVRLPPGVGFDPGGFGKGLAADIVVRELMEDGARGAMINLGGDLAVRGVPPDGDEWTISVSEPTVVDGCITRAHLVDGALATSTTAKRRWRTPTGTCTHVLDPKSGRSIDGETTLATVIAGEAWWAEVCATALLVRREVAGDVFVDDLDEAALLVSSDGRLERFAGFERFEA